MLEENNRYMPATRFHHFSISSYLLCTTSTHTLHVCMCVYVFMCIRGMCCSEHVSRDSWHHDPGLPNTPVHSPLCNCICQHPVGRHVPHQVFPTQRISCAECWMSSWRAYGHLWEWAEQAAATSSSWGQREPSGMVTVHADLEGTQACEEVPQVGAGASPHRRWFWQWGGSPALCHCSPAGRGDGALASQEEGLSVLLALSSQCRLSQLWSAGTVFPAATQHVDPISPGKTASFPQLGTASNKAVPTLPTEQGHMWSRHDSPALEDSFGSLPRIRMELFATTKTLLQVLNYRMIDEGSRYQ